MNEYPYENVEQSVKVSVLILSQHIIFY